MKYTLFIIAVFLLMSCASRGPHVEDARELQLKISNPSNVDVTDGLVLIDLEELDKNKKGFVQGVIKQEGKPVNFQYNDLDGDGSPDQLAFVISIPANASTTVSVSRETESPVSFPKRTHAEIGVKEGGSWKDRVYEGGSFVDIEELNVPPEHTDHSFYIRYEGPGWESEKVGYRFYLDWRNATDIFGKKKDAIVLNQVGLDDFDSYHEIADWGMDILKVGDALGIGALGCWSEGKVLRMAQTDSIRCSIPIDGNVQSMVRTEYSGWATPYGKTEVLSEISIGAGSRLSRHNVKLSEQIDSLCTGIVKHDGVEVLRDLSHAKWNYLATWGNQSLANDSLGMAIFFRKDLYLGMGEDKYNYAVILKSDTKNSLDYYFAACWEQEEHGVRTKAGFEAYLNECVAILNSPLTWSIINPAN